VGGVDQRLRVGVGGSGFGLDFVEGGVVVGHKAGEVDFGFIADFALPAQASGSFAKEVQGEAGLFEVNLAGEHGAEHVGRGVADAGFGVESWHVGGVGGRGSGAELAPVVEADLAPVHGGVGAAESVVLDVFTNAF